MVSTDFNVTTFGETVPVSEFRGFDFSGQWNIHRCALSSRWTFPLTSSLRETLFPLVKRNTNFYIYYLSVVCAIHSASERILRDEESSNFLLQNSQQFERLFHSPNHQCPDLEHLSGSGDARFPNSHSPDVLESTSQIRAVDPIEIGTPLWVFTVVVILLFCCGRERWVLMYLLRLTAKTLCSAAFFLSALHTSSLRAAQSYRGVCTAILLGK